MTQLSKTVKKLYVEKVVKLLRKLPLFEEKQPTNQYEILRGKYNNKLLIFYTSGKIVYEKDTQINMLLNPYVEEWTEINLSEYDLIIGQDEAGKGEIFGPIIVASLALEPEKLLLFKQLGIKDSKKIAKEKIHDLNATILKNNTTFDVVKIGAEKFQTFYNDIKKEKKNLNDLLAWAHIKALENVLQNLNSKKIEFKRILIIIDEFDKVKTELRIKKLLKPNMVLIQQTKADETNIVCSAASIIAKSRQLEELQLIKNELGENLRYSNIKNLLKHQNAEKFIKMHYAKSYLNKKRNKTKREGK